MPQQSLVQQIAEICNGLATQLDDADADLSITLKRSPTRRRITSGDDLQNLSNQRIRTVQLCFPGRSAEDAWRFTVVLRLLHIIHDGLVNDKVATKRDIYYQDPELFGSQAVVDRYIEDLAFTLAVPRAQLNVSAAAKGLMYGSFSMQHKTGNLLDLSLAQKGVLIPDAQDIVFADLSNTPWVLVIEKEATFQLLITSTEPALRRGLIVTAKGYPDVATRSFLEKICTPSLQNNFSRPRLFALVDFDPDGFAIYSHYKHGPNHRSGIEQSSLPSIQLLSLTSQQLDLCQHNAKSMLVLTGRDRKRASNMLRDDPVADEEDIRLDLQRMLMLSVKVELQHLEGRIVNLCAGVLNEV